MEIKEYLEYTRRYKGSIKLVVLDYAGVTVDYGCCATASAFIEAFKRKGIEITMEQARGPMGRSKREHIKCILSWYANIAAQWRKVYGRDWTEEDVDDIFINYFRPTLLKIIREHSKIIPGVVETVEWLQKEGIKVGSTTGYFKEAAQVILEEAIKQGYKPEVILCPDDIAAMFKIPATRAGRPYPYMILANMLMTESFPPAAVVKVDDAEVGIKEGLNAGVWTVGVSKTGALVGLNEEEIENMEKKNPEKLRTMIEVANNKLRRTGAHYVIETISELPHVIMNINSRLKSGEPP